MASGHFVPAAPGATPPRAAELYVRLHNPQLSHPMGLDWNPVGKPKPGHEEEFVRLFKVLGELPVNVSWSDKLLRRLRGIDREAIDKRWREIQLTPYETLLAPQVGRSPEADAWALEQYPNRKDKSVSAEQFMKDMSGYYVLDLVESNDGLPWYSNSGMGYVERFSFRAQFLRDCEAIIGNDTLEKCYVSCLAPGLESLGHELRAWATSFAAREGLQHVEHVQRPSFETETREHQVHVLYSAARWCEFWSSRGHGLEAYW